MRLALAFLLAATAIAPAAAQEKLSPSEEMLRQRFLLKEKFNKGYDVQVENSQDRIEGRCKAEARKRISVIHPIQRRKYIKDCIERTRR